MAKNWSREQTEKAFPDLEVVESESEHAGADATHGRIVPGRALRRSSALGADMVPPAPGPSMEELRRKYLGIVGPSSEPARGLRRSSGPLGRPAAPSGADSTAADNGDEIDVVRVRTRRGVDGADDELGPRTIITSKRHGPLGSQG
ncbi:hypothetical protein [Gemmatimonas sp.]|uniref:hypothetical protein n=1 Tax=Gemmatimonas sp. TaxID=1962908 RepID=UPI003F6FE749